MKRGLVWTLFAVVVLWAQDAGVLLNSGWTLRPAGKQVQLDTLPMKSLLSPDGKFVLALHAGLRQPSVRVLPRSGRAPGSPTCSTNNGAAPVKT